MKLRNNMIKKRFLIILLILALVLCTACSEKETGPVRKKTTTDAAIRYGTIAMETMEDYLDGNLSLKAAQSKLETCQRELDKSEDFYDGLLSIRIGTCSNSLYLQSVGRYSKAEIREKIQEIYDFLYEK